jgi:pimeloyl-ACP methyl ester carboxylesterase
LPEPLGGYVLTDADVRQRGWGEIHADSYGTLLHALQMRLNQTFGFDELNKKRFVQSHWKDVMACDPQKWGKREFEPLTEDHLQKNAELYFPVYAVGYNWLEDCDSSSRRLEQRIQEIIEFWSTAKRRCDKVILVTHSMGGLVARACAKRIPEKIAGVIHGVMPALGAPVAYRRMACGSESWSPSNGPIKNLIASRVAKILGDTAEKTTAVLATAPGALELLPNHLYQQPWLHVRVIKTSGAAGGIGYGAKDDVVRLREFPEDYLHFPNARLPNPYDLYRDLTSWYRLIDPAIADPSGKYESAKGGVKEAIWSAIATAERFHRGLEDFYHPNTFAFYGDDRNELSYDRVRWVARQRPGSVGALTAGNISAAKSAGHSDTGVRHVMVEGKTELHFAPDVQEARGDGTVPSASGAGVVGKVKHAFATRGYDHQGAYNNNDMMMLTLRLIAKIVQEMS